MSSLAYGRASTASFELVNNMPKQSSARDCDLATSNLYQSIPLPKDSKAVRLLKLAPANGDSPISGSLILADLDQQPGFVALSYVWGSFAPHVDYFRDLDGDMRIVMERKLDDKPAYLSDQQYWFALTDRSAMYFSARNNLAEIEYTAT